MELYFPDSSMHQRAHYFLFLLLDLFSKHCLAHKLVFAGGFVLVYGVLSVLTVLCGIFSLHVLMTVDVHGTDPFLSCAF